MNVGDWATSYSAGIWQIYRILEYNAWDPVAEGIRPTTAVFSKRFLSPVFKRSFREEVCDASFVKPLAADAAVKLKEFIAANPKTHAAFLQYTPKPIHAVFNARIHRNKMTGTKMASLIPNDRTFTVLEILPFLEKVGFDTGQNLHACTARFISKGHACDDDGYLPYIFDAVLNI